METVAANGGGGGGGRETASRYGKREQAPPALGCGGRYFQMPLHYPRYSKEDYEAMPEWQLDRLLSEYGLPVAGSLQQKRTFAIGAFLWGCGGDGGH